MHDSYLNAKLVCSINSNIKNDLNVAYLSTYNGSLVFTLILDIQDYFQTNAFVKEMDYALRKTLFPHKRKKNAAQNCVHDPHRHMAAICNSLLNIDSPCDYQED